MSIMILDLLGGITGIVCINSVIFLLPAIFW